MSHHVNRRQWLASATAAMSVPYWFTSAQAQTASSKNDRPIAAVIGTGGRGTSMGWHQFGHFADLVAICDVDLREAERAAATIEEKIGVRPKIYHDYRKLLERNDIEVVGNATPDHWHTKINIDACRAAKDLYAEKPLTFTIDEGKKLRDVVHETDRILQVGSQQRSGSQFRTACELVRNGRIGRLQNGWRPPALQRGLPRWPLLDSTGAARTQLGFLAGAGTGTSVLSAAIGIPPLARVCGRYDHRLGASPLRHRPLGDGHGRVGATLGGRQGLSLQRGQTELLQQHRRLRRPFEVPW